MIGMLLFVLFDADRLNSSWLDFKDSDARMRGNYDWSGYCFVALLTRANENEKIKAWMIMLAVHFWCCAALCAQMTVADDTRRRRIRQRRRFLA